MGEVRGNETAASVEAFIEAVEPAARREDARILDGLFRRVTGAEPRMWGPSIVGYGSYHYRRPDGRSAHSHRIGFSPRKAKNSLYLSGCDGKETSAEFEELLTALGKHSRGAACIYVNKLADIDLGVLEQMAAISWRQSHADFPED